jgi:transcriptional regulator with XRE-family HTH domain
MTTPAQIKKYREDKGLSQQALAEKLGVDQATVSRIENGAVPARPVAILLQSLIGAPAVPATSKRRKAA